MNYLYRNNKCYSVSHLPAVPHLLVELLNLCHDADAGFEGFARIIEQDAGLTSKILQLANSPMFRQWKDIGDLRRMLIILGMSNVKTIVTTCAIEQFFSQFSNELNQQIRQVWVRSIFRANLCERLAKLLDYQKPGEAFLAGLLHQTGILVLLQNNASEYLQLLEFYHDSPHSFCQREQELLGVDHCEIGAALVASWELDSFIADALQFQWAHAEELRNAPTLLRILAVATPFNAGQNHADNIAALTKAAQLLGLTAETILNCTREALGKSASMLSALGLADAMAAISSYHTSGTLPEDHHSSARLREAVRHVALSQAVPTVDSEDLITFVKQVRVSFSVVFPLRQLLFLSFDEARSLLTPINDLNLQQLKDLSWTSADHNSQVVKTLLAAKETSLTAQNATISDRQLLRLLNSDTACLAPLVHKNKCLGLIALGLDHSAAPLSGSDLSLLKLFNQEIARRYATFTATLSRSFALSATEFRKLVHEVSNPLTIINNYLYTLGKKLGNDDPAQGDLHAISEEIDRVGRILLHAQSSAEGPEEVQRFTDINSLIEDLDRILSGSIYKTKQVQSVLHLDKQLPALRCSADKLKQVLINLTKNAVEAVGAGGVIQISTRDGIFQDQQSYVEVSVKDNGPGIDPRILKKLFSPVTSTKSGHSGLGLVVVNSLIKEMGGNISCCSSPEMGTEFNFLLPRRTATESTGEITD